MITIEWRLLPGLKPTAASTLASDWNWTPYIQVEGVKEARLKMEKLKDDRLFEFRIAGLEN